MSVRSIHKFTMKGFKALAEAHHLKIAIALCMVSWSESTQPI